MTSFVALMRAVRGLRSITMALLSEVHAGFECSVVETGDEIDFGVEMKNMAAPGATALPVDDDPFLCRFERLGHVWKTRKPKPDLELSPEDTGTTDASRRSLLRGKGPKPVTAFGG